MSSRLKGFAAVAALTIGAALAGAVTQASAQDVTLEVWSHEADEPAKVAFRELAVKNLEKAHPGVKVKITGAKNPLFAALKTALPAGKGPTSSTSGDQTNTSLPATSFARRPRQLEQHQALGTRSGSGQRSWHPAGGLHRRAPTIRTLKQLGVTLPANGS
jgi:membrane-bound lytic murein transglycosylase